LLQEVTTGMAGGADAVARIHGGSNQK
jgi:hypothetical protein